MNSLHAVVCQEQLIETLHLNFLSHMIVQEKCYAVQCQGSVSALHGEQGTPPQEMIQPSDAITMRLCWSTPSQDILLSS